MKAKIKITDIWKLTSFGGVIISCDILEGEFNKKDIIVLDNIDYTITEIGYARTKDPTKTIGLVIKPNEETLDELKDKLLKFKDLEAIIK